MNRLEHFDLKPLVAFEDDPRAPTISTEKALEDLRKTLGKDSPLYKEMVRHAEISELKMHQLARAYRRELKRISTT